MSKIDDYNHWIEIRDELRQSIERYSAGRFEDRLDLSIDFVGIEKHQMGNDTCVARIKIPGFYSGRMTEVYATVVLCLQNKMEDALSDAVARASELAEKCRLAAKEEALAVLAETTK